jgi:putative inorganic carbon (HCO3(-)) transporter
MRDLLITLIVLIGCFYTLKKPYVGVLLWSWLSYMNPHRLTFGFAYSMPFAQITAITVIGSMFFSKEVRKIPINGLTIWWIVFVMFMGVTTIFAYFPDDAMTQYKKILKIQLVVFLTMMLITDIKKMQQLIWVIVLSIGYFGAKGGLFTVLSGGSYRVWGPPDSYWQDNNACATTVLMIIPFMVYLRQTTEKKIVKHGLLIAAILSLLSVVGSQSRGALIAITTVGCSYWIKSDKKIVSTIIVALLAIALLSFMPESWYSRMNSIKTYDEDASAMGRINAWEYAFNAANHNILGMGFNSWSLETFMLYAPDPLDVHAAHSIYFSVLGDHGWIGLILFVSILYGAWRKLSTVIKATNGNNEMKNVNDLAKMVQVSLLAYLSGGAFLSLSYFDLPWHIVSFSVLLERYMVNPSLDKNRFHQLLNI